MIELPEALARAKECELWLANKTVKAVYPPASPHKFCWFQGKPEDYGVLLEQKRVLGASGFGIFVELEFEQGRRLCVNDGVTMVLYQPQSPLPEKYQLRIDFTDGCVLVFTVSMYGGILCHSGKLDNEYYDISKTSISPICEDFNEQWFEGLLSQVPPKTSIKAFLATKQRIPGLGNGVLQDILFQAGIHPKRSVKTLTKEETARLYYSTKNVLQEMTSQGGRDTEKNLLGEQGGYRTLLSKNTWQKGCPRCSGPIVKTSYMGGTVYYCEHCQPL